MKHFRSLLLIFAAVAFACYAAEQINIDAGGIHIGGAAADKIGFHGATAVAQRSGADQTALTDSTGGAVSNATLAATSGIFTVAIPVNLASVADGDVVTNYTPGYRFKVLAMSFAVSVPVTTADKATSLNAEIGTTNLTGGVIALTSANCTPLGALVAGSSITAANTGTSTDTISFEASSTTAFVEGAGFILVKLQNMDTQDNFAKTAELLNELRAALVAKGLIAGS